MKNLATILILSFSIAVSTGASAQHFKDKITKEIKFDNRSSSNVFYLSNINGHIKVEGYDGDKILLEAERILYAKSDSRLAQAKDEISLGVIDRLDTIIVYMKSPCGEFSKQSWGFNSKDKNKGNSGIKGKIKAKEKNKEIRRKNLSWNYNMRNCEYDYDFKNELHTQGAQKPKYLFVNY